MLNNYTWYVIQHKDANGLMYAYAHRVRNNINIAHYPPFNADTVYSVNACDTKKDALTLADHWNECSIKNGCYMFKRVFDNSGNVTGFESF